MARFTRGKSLVRIFALARSGEERLIAAIKPERERPKSGFARNIKIYDYGTGLSYVRYTVGCAGPQGRWLSESASEIVAVFKQAGITPPKVRSRLLMGRIIAPFFSNAPQADAAPAQRIG